MADENSLYKGYKVTATVLSEGVVWKLAPGLASDGTHFVWLGCSLAHQPSAEGFYMGARDARRLAVELLKAADMADWASKQ